MWTATSAPPPPATLELIGSKVSEITLFMFKFKQRPYIEKKSIYGLWFKFISLVERSFPLTVFSGAVQQ